MAVAEAREPWSLPNSIFKPRAKECDARAFLDGNTVRMCLPMLPVTCAHTNPPCHFGWLIHPDVLLLLDLLV